MLVESLAIFTIFVVMVFVFLRAGKRLYAVSVSPLLVVPLTNILFNAANELLKWKISVVSHMLVLIIALAVSVLLIGVFANFFKTKKSKVGYVIICGSFITSLSLIFLYNIYTL